MIAAATLIPPPLSLASLLDSAPQGASAAPPPVGEAQFVAGQLFSGERREAWMRLEPSSVLQRVVLDGFSEYLSFPPTADGTRRPRPTRSGHAPSALKQRDFVTAEVANLRSIQAVSDVTHVRHNPREVCYTLGLLVAERHG